MGGGGQANSGQATGAYNSQQAASAQDMALSKQNADVQKRMVDMLFGNGTKGSTGTLSSFLNPASLDRPGLNSNYQTQFNEASNQLAKDYANQRGSLAQGWANAGMGTNNTPSGFQADQQRKLGSSEADTRGATYAGLKGQQYSDTLNNFWNASNIASGNAATGGRTAADAAGSAGSSSASLYGTAGQYHPSQMGNVLGSAIGAGGTVGAAAMCAAEGSQVLLSDGSWREIAKLVKGDKVQGIDGRPDELLDDPKPSLQEVCEVKTHDLKIKVSLSHTFARHSGGYSFAAKSFGEQLDCEPATQSVMEVRIKGARMLCFHLLLKRSHGYCVNGFWSLE